MFEHKSEPVLPPHHFARRLLRCFGITLAFMGVSLLFGVWGYHHFDNLPWVDALLNASMILGGMGPVDTLTTEAGKLFASFYALYSGLVLIAAMGVMLAPLLHRMMHLFHADEDENGEGQNPRKPARSRKVRA